MENYFLVDAISNSSLNFLDPETGGCPQKMRDFLDGKLSDDTTKSLTVGDMVHKYMLEPDKFKVADFDKPADGICEIVSKLYEANKEYGALQWESLSDEAIGRICEMVDWQKNWKLETRINKVKETGKQYWDFLWSSQDYIVLDPLTKETVANCVASLVSDKTAGKVLGVWEKPFEIHDELEIYWKYEKDGITFNCKSKIDRLIVNPSNKTFHIVDLKTTSKIIHNFPDSFQFYKYYRQIAFYEMAVLQWLHNTKNEEYIPGRHYIVAVETKGYFNTRTYIVSPPYMAKGREEIHQLMRILKHHMDTDNWIYRVNEKGEEQNVYILMPGDIGSAE
jgi:hypothetical protein